MDKIINSIIKTTIQSVVLHPVTLELEFRDFSAIDIKEKLVEEYSDDEKEDCDEKEDDYKCFGKYLDECPDDETFYNSKLKPEVKSMIDNLTWDTVLYQNVKLINIESKVDGVRDGIDMCFKEYFPSVKTFKYSKSYFNGVTIKDLSECVYRMKINKYDHWNEILDDLKIKVDGESLFVKVDFIYCS